MKKDIDAHRIFNVNSIATFWGRGMKLVSGIALLIMIAGWFQSSPAQSQANSFESIFAKKVVERLEQDRNLTLFLQNALKGGNPSAKNPKLYFSSSGGDCRIILIVKVGEEEFIKRWDGSIESNAPTALGYVVDLRDANSNLTEFIRRENGLDVIIGFGNKESGTDIYQFGGSTKWESRRPGRGGGLGYNLSNNPLPMAVFLYGSTVAYRLWFHVDETERDDVIRDLKELFVKCRH